MTHTTDKLREEWRKTDIAKDFAPFEEAAADWWLSKLETTLKDRESELAEKLKGMLEENWPEESEQAKKFPRTYSYTEGKNRTIEKILSLLHTDTNSENK